jgi:hypothetical protein
MKMICSSHAGLTFFELFEKYPEPLMDLFQQLSPRILF